MAERPAEFSVRIPSWIDPLLDAHDPAGGDEAAMRLAIRLARENVERGDGGPFGALIVESATGRPVAGGVNLVTRLGSSVLHAEIVAILIAQRRVGSFTLRGPGRHALVTSCAPCAMCLGAALWSGVDRVVYGARREDAASIGFEEGPVFPGSWAYLEARGVSVRAGVLREEAAAILRLYEDRGGRIYNP